MLIYVAGPYGSNTAENGTGEGFVKGTDENIEQARKIAIELWEKGHAVICPHLNTAHFENDCKATWEDYLKGDFDMITRCDALVLTPDWMRSKGATMEMNHARSLRIPIYIYPDIPNPHPTELRAPAQSKHFIETVMSMYRVHLQKNADYSPANILATGQVGLVTRLWDKMARLMNLTGFRIVVEEGTFEAPREPKNESIEDSFMDMAVYAVIGLLLKKGVWGR